MFILTNKALIRSVMTCFSLLEITGRHPTLKFAEPAKQDSAHHWKLFQGAHQSAHTAFNSPRVYDCITKLWRQRTEIMGMNMFAV
jgi:hypothetical protein